MVCFGLLHICNQMLLLSTCYSLLCLNWEESPLNIYLNNNIPQALYKLLYKIAFHKRPQAFLKIYLNCFLASPPCCGPASPSAWAADPAAPKAGACSTDPALKSCQQLPESQGKVSVLILLLSQELNNPVTSRNRLFSDAGKWVLEPSVPAGTTHSGWGWKHRVANPMQLSPDGGWSWGCWHLSVVFKWWLQNLQFWPFSDQKTFKTNKTHSCTIQLESTNLRRTHHPK